MFSGVAFLWPGARRDSFLKRTSKVPIGRTLRAIPLVAFPHAALITNLSIIPPFSQMASQPPATFTPDDLLEGLSLEDSEIPFEDDGTVAAELPTYSGPSSRRQGGHARRGRTEHIYTIQDVNERPWLALKIKSWASSATSLPVFVEGQEIRGIVELDLKKSDSINAITVTVSDLLIIIWIAQTLHDTPKLVGRVEFSRIDTKRFLTVSETVWNSSRGDPHSPNPSQKAFTKKLLGSYSWPFALNLPEKIYRTTKHSKTLMLQPIENVPPYFDGKGWRPSIHYELSLDVKRSGPFRLGSTCV